MLSISKYITLLTFLLVSIASLAQGTESRNNLSKKNSEDDTVKISFTPKGVRLGLDLVGVTKTIIDSDLTEFELSADIELYRYLINAEYGQFEVTRSGNNSSIYRNNGSYFRTGIDINFLKTETNKNTLFFGFRYGRARFDDQLQYLQTNTIYGDANINRSNSNISARWLELTAGLKLHIAHNFWLGFTNRFKFAQKADESTLLIPHDIPGYGRASKQSYWGFNYQLMYRIPFSRK